MIIFVINIHEGSGDCNKFHNEELHDAFPQQNICVCSDQEGRNEQETWHVLRRQKCIEKNLLQNLKEKTKRVINWDL
jgi:hypothetical protein